MKRPLMSLVLFLGTSFFLSSLQGHLQLLSLPIPHFWFIIITYYSFRKSLFFSLTANFLHGFIICLFSSIFIGLLLLLINLSTFFFVIIGERFPVNNKHIVIGAGAGCFLFHFFKWFVQCLNYGFSQPQFFQWISTSLATLIVAPFFLYIFDKIDKKIHFERIEVLKSLRV